MTVENFLSFREAHFNFEEAGLTLVEGENLDDSSARSNGSGKSAMIDALVWCLFGKTLRGYENDEVVHRKVGDGCLVKVSLEDGDEMYTVTRARRHSKLKNVLRVTHDNFGEDMSGPSNTETQEIVDKLLGCSMRTFLSSVVFGQDRAYRFSSLTDKEQKEILDEVLGVERFARACSAARTRHSFSVGIVASTQRDLEKAEHARDTAEEEVNDLKNKDTNFEQLRERDLKGEREKLTKAKEWVKKTGKADVDKIRDDLEKHRKGVTVWEKAVADVGEASAKHQGIVTIAKAKVDELRKRLKKHEALTGECPTCGQEVDKDGHGDLLVELKKELKVTAAAMDKIMASTGEFDEQLAKAKGKLKAARDAVLTREKELNEGVGDHANAKAWKQRVIDITAQVEKIEAETNPYASMMKKAETRYKKHCDEAGQLVVEMTAEEAKLKIAEFWVNAFGARGLRSLLIDSSLPLLNEEAARISRAVTGGAISIVFSATSDLKSGKTIDRFEVRVDNKHGAGSYQGNSAGEKAKVDLCVGLALQRLVASRSSASFNVCFFDEVFDHLDAAAHERVVDVLSEIDKESIFVVSHDEDLKAWFPASLRIVKKGGFSTVEAG